MRRDESKAYSANSELFVEVIPAEGGRISSLKSLRSRLEFLTQSRRRGPYPQAGLDTRFQEGSCAGIEECLPTVGPSGPETEVARRRITATFGNYLGGCSRPLTGMSACPQLDLAGRSDSPSDSLWRTRPWYAVKNIGSTTRSFLYACHPLFAVSRGDRVLLPREIRELRLDYSKGDRLGMPGSTICCPVTQEGLRLDVADGPEAGTAEMFYSSRLNEGGCGIDRKISGQVLEVSFDSKPLPYLGLWLCYCGWPSDGEEPCNMRWRWSPRLRHATRSPKRKKPTLPSCSRQVRRTIGRSVSG